MRRLMAGHSDRLPSPGHSALALEQGLQVGERTGLGRYGRVFRGQCADTGVVDQARMLVVVTVHAQQLPVAAVGRVVVVVVVAMVDCQLLQVGAGEIARAAAAGPRIHLQGALAVALLALRRTATRLGDDAVEPGVVGHGHGRGDPVGTMGKRVALARLPPAWPATGSGPIPGSGVWLIPDTHAHRTPPSHPLRTVAHSRGPGTGLVDVCRHRASTPSVSNDPADPVNPHPAISRSTNRPRRRTRPGK